MESRAAVADGAGILRRAAGKIAAAESDRRLRVRAIANGAAMAGMVGRLADVQGARAGLAGGGASRPRFGTGGNAGVRILPLPALALALLIGSLTAIPYLGFHFEYLPGSPIDARLSMFLLEHGHQWVSGQTLPRFLDGPFFYPVRAVISYSDTFAGQLPFYAPSRWLGFDRETSFQIFIAVGFWLNFLATAWVLAKLRFHWVASLFGAYIFAFSQAALAQIGHSQLHYRFGIPLAWYFFHRFLEQFSWKDLFWCLLFVAWQSYCALYEGYFLALFLAVFALVTMLRRPVLRQYFSQSAMTSVAAQAAVLIGFLVVLAALARPYVNMAGDAQLAAA